eukprot:scaffold62822_cov41-Prasinocladus_malaysianus.AAC.2
MPRREVESPVLAPKLNSSCTFQILHDQQREWCVQSDALKLHNEALICKTRFLHARLQSHAIMA